MNQTFMFPHHPNGTVKTVPEMTLDELQSVLEITNRIRDPPGEAVVRARRFDAALTFVERYRQMLEDRIKEIETSTN